MDKKSNRSDLLSAGRKKLQQYRQKKDTKVKDGKGKDKKGSNKSSNKADLSEPKDTDTDVVSAPGDLSAECSQHSDSQLHSHSSPPASLDSPLDSSIVLETSAGTSADTGDVSEEPVLDGDIDPPSLEPVSAETSLIQSHDSQGPTGVREVEIDKNEIEGAVSLQLTGEAHDPEIGSTDATAAEGLLEGDQVSVVGAMQETDSFGLTYLAQEVKPQLEGDDKLTGSASDEGGMIASVSGSISETLAASDQRSDVSSIGFSGCEENHTLLETSVPVEAANVAGEESTDSLCSLHQEGNDVMDRSSNESVLHLQSNHYVEVHADSDIQVDSECHKVHGSEASTVIEFENSARVEGNSVDTAQLAEVLKRLSEGDLKYLIQSGEMGVNGNLDAPQTSTVDLPQTFQEQLYLANVSKEFFYAFEKHQQQSGPDHQHDEVPVVNTPLLDRQESNRTLDVKLARCRSDLDAALSERVEFQDLYRNAKEEAMRSSMAVDELKIKLEEAVGSLSSSAADMDRYKVQLEASKVEKEELLNNLMSLSEQTVKSEAVLAQQAHDNQKLSADLADSGTQLAQLHQEVEKLKGSLGFATDELIKFQEENNVLVQENQVLSGDLVDCRHQLMALQRENSDLNTSLAVTNEEHKQQKDHEEFLIQEIERLSAELVVFHDKVWTQHQENLILVKDKEVLSGDLVDCRHQLKALQQEKCDLKTNLGVKNEEHKKQNDHDEFFFQEIERLSAELVVFQDKVLIQHEENVQVEADLRKAMSRIEQLAEENIILQSSLEIYKAKISEVDGRHIHISSAGMGSMAQMDIAVSGSSEEILVKQDAETVIPPILCAPDDVPGGTGVSEVRPGFQGDGESVVAMRSYLEEAENLMQKLEKATDGMHSHSVSLSRSIGKNAAPGVSKLIQAFESKANIDDTDPEVNTSTGNAVPSESYLVAQDQISHLRCVFKILAQHVEHVEAFILEEKLRCEAAVVSRRELEIEIEALKGISNNLEVRNIELEVVCGAMNQHAHDIEANKIQLEDLLGALKRDYAALQLQNVELFNKLTTSRSRISDLQVLLKDIRRNSNEVASTFSNEIDTLQGEMGQKINAVQRGWETALSQIQPVVEKLDALLGSADSYPPQSEPNDAGILGHLSFSLCAACEVIEKLMLKNETHEALSSSYMQLTDRLHSVDEEHSLAVALLQKVSADLLKLLNVSSEQFDDSGFHEANSNQHDPMNADYYEAVVSKVGNLVGNLQELKESNKKLYSDLLNRTSEIEELNKYCLDSDAVLKLVLDVKEVLRLQDTEMDMDSTPVVLLQSSVWLLMQKFKAAEEQVCSLTEECNCQVIELGKLQGNIEELNVLNLQHRNEMLILKESLTQAKNACDSTQAELLDKTKELEQSEQRVASVREKLSIAVAKGKGLVVQRDSLKHSLSEMASELEKYSQELRLKDSRILEVEEKLKSYSEAGERMEALESELTYIRNSATALRESFLMKDSALQRIEELMEDLDLPDHFHSKDIVEKVDWLAKSVAGNSFLPADWDQRSSVGGGSHSDAGHVTDGGKEDILPTLNPVDDLRRQYDELQTKFYELAEQNDMLEQSLMERNVLVQRWEEVLDRINTPPQIRSMEPEERIHWLGTALSEADHHMRSLQQKIEKLENYCESLSSDLKESRRRKSEVESSFQAIVHEKDSALSVADEDMKFLQQKIHSLENYSASLSSQLEESERKMSEFESSLQVVLHDKEILSSNFVALTSDHELALHTVAQYEHDLDRLRKDVDMLQGSLTVKMGNDNYIQHIESELRRLQGLIHEALQYSGSEEDSSDVSNIERLEQLIMKLLTHDRGDDLDSHAAKEVAEGHVSKRDVNVITESEENAHVPVETVADIDVSKPRSTVLEGQNVAVLRTELAEALDEVASLREKYDALSKRNQLVATEFEALDKKKDGLQELLKQEEQKSASLREKLNLAVRKGKSLVQQRDSLKQNIEEMTNEIEKLKSEVSLRDNSLLESGQKISAMSLQIETHEASEAENLSLKNRLIEAEQQLQHNGHTLSIFLNKLGEIDVGGEINAHDPLLKLEGIGKICSELHATTASLEQETRKSKKAAELLLAELNEVQERNDGLQEELARAYNEISTVSSERDLTNSAKIEALSHLAQVSDERKLYLGEMERLKSSVRELKKVFFDMSNAANDVFAKDLELLNDLKTHVESCLGNVGADLVVAKDYGNLVSGNKRFKEFWSKSSLWNSDIPDQLDDNVGYDAFRAAELIFQQLSEAIGEFKERLRSHSTSVKTEVDQFKNAISTMLGELVSQRNTSEAIMGEKIRLEAIINERDTEGLMLHKSLSFLYEACCSSITEIENRKAQLVGQSLASGMPVKLPLLPSFDGGNFNRSTLSSSEECVKALSEKLIVAVNELVDIEVKNREDCSKEMRTTILNLQKELQEKDIQRERICTELVGQIREAESTAAKCSRDLQSVKNYAHDLENKLESMGKERSLMEQRVTELQQGQLSSIELGEKVTGLSNKVAAKEQEIESLMQALDEEENQMEALRIKVEELETVVEQKNSELEHVEASRAKAVKKLSVTVSKFDELHRMSEGLLSEIEDLRSQLQDRDSEISFLRQEVTRCTNDVLEATKTSKERSSTELHELLTWLDTVLSRVSMRDAHGGNEIGNNFAQCKENLQQEITSMISELEDSRITAQNKDTLLQAERNKVEELSRRKAALEFSLKEKELHLISLQGAGVSGLGTSEIVEVEPVSSKWATPVSTTTSQVRSLRKTNNDQVAIAIDADAATSSRFEDEDDDKVHGFKSLTTSRFVPKFTRPVSDMIDGLWVSCDRALMRQPALRLGIIFYWALLHAFLASIIV